MSWFCLSEQFFLELRPDSTALIRKQKANLPVGQLPFLLQMWACALGHMDAAVVLYKWDRRAISIPDSLGRLPLAIARSRGHVKLAECLEQLQRDEQTQLGQNPRIQCPSSTDSNTESWVSQWHSELVASQEPQKGVTVISSTNTGKTSWRACFVLLYSRSENVGARSSPVALLSMVNSFLVLHTLA